MSHHDRTRELFQRFGYDPDDPVPRSEDGERVIPERLLDVLAAAPYVPLHRVHRFDTMNAARQHWEFVQWRSYRRRLRRQDDPARA